MNKSTKGLSLLALLCCLCGCKGGYTYTFNDNVLFSPNDESKKSEDSLLDTALQACLNETLQANQQLTAAEVKLLACPGSGVESLQGIGTLSALEQLELSDNRLRDVRPLLQLRNLRVLSIRNNQLDTALPLLELPLLRFISLLGNPSLRCDEIATMRKKLGNTLVAPAHCAQ
jgi:internalin A